MGELNYQQCEAVEAIDGPLLVVAGPGTGKTKTLTARIGHFITSGAAKPSEILALTFTNKAAEEMRARVAVSLDGEVPTITTFHALCYQLLGGDMQFISNAERTMLIKQLRKAAELKSLTTNELGLEISRLKNQASGAGDKPLDSLRRAYDEALKERGLHDFES